MREVRALLIRALISHAHRLMHGDNIPELVLTIRYIHRLRKKQGLPRWPTQDMAAYLMSMNGEKK